MFEDNLEIVQAEILKYYGVTEADMEEATELYKDDPDVAGFVSELEDLYLGKSIQNGPACKKGASI